MKLICVISVICLISGSDISFAQDKENETFPVIETFRHTQLINAQTVEMLQTGGFEFKIQHRFGEIGFDKRIISEFFGLALPGNIRLSLTFPFTERFYAGIGWSTFKKIVDIENKYLLLSQTEENEMPVSVAVYFNIATTTQKFPPISENVFFSDSTVFKYIFAHRIYYNTQIIIARKFSEWLSVQITPVFIYKNLVEAGKENHTIALPVSGRFKLSNNFSILFEYAYIFNNRMDNFRDPLSIGVEFATPGHIFQIIMSSTNNIPEQEIYTNKSANYFKGNFYLGFNIKRILFFSPGQAIKDN